MNNVLCDDISFLTEIYSLKAEEFEIVKEDLKYIHAYKVIGNPQIMIEGFTNTLNKIGEFFKKMIDKIKEFFKKILMYVQSFFMDIDKFVKKYKDELNKVDKVDFDIYGFNWTMHEPPNMEPFKELVNSYNSSASDATKLKKADIQKEQNEFLEEENLDRLRGKILGSNEPISDDVWQETVRKYYRDGTLDEVEIHIDTAEYRKFVSNAEQLQKDKKQAEKTRDDLVYLLEKTQKFFDKNASSVYTGKGTTNLKVTKLDVDTDKNTFKSGDPEYVSYSDTTAAAFELLLRFNYVKASRISGMVNIVATERANAYKDQVKFCRDIIRKGLFKSDDDTDKKDED